MSRPTRPNLDEIHNHCLNLDSREIYLHGHFDSDDDIDYKAAVTFIKNLDILEQRNKNQIIINLYSLGGLDESLFAIYDRIKHSSCHITTITHGVCASAAAIVLQASDLRLSMPNCYFLIHEGYINTGEVTQRQKDSADNLNKKIIEKMYNILGERCKAADYFKEQNLKTEKSVIAFLKKKLEIVEDLYLLPEDALKYGLIDGIIGGEFYPNLESVKIVE